MKKHSVVGIIYNSKGEVLLGKKRKNSNKFLAGKWHIPGETVENGETDEKALIRGMKEETNLEIRVGNYLDFHITHSGKRANWYECFALTDNLIPGSDLENVKFVKKRDVLKSCSKKSYSLWPKRIMDYFN